MDVTSLLKRAVEEQASDLFIVAGMRVSCKIAGKITATDEAVLRPDDTRRLVEDLYQLAGRSIQRLQEYGDDDFSLSLPGVSRFRVSAYRQRGSLSAVVRVVHFQLPDPVALNIPEGVMELANITKGLVLVTGPANSGKSTTLACLIDRINNSRSGHIITLEDPIEYLHSHKQCIVSQRELSSDTESYISALRAALRQSPDVILLGEMRDAETIATAMTAAWGMICDYDKLVVCLDKSHKSVDNLLARRAFTVSLANEANMAAADLVGITSGHKTPHKLTATGWTALPCGVDAPMFDELPLTLECKVIYKQLQDGTALPKEINDRFYPQDVDSSNPSNNKDYHITYYGEIVNAYILEEEE